jgi:hypothetical protein
LWGYLRHWGAFLGGMRLLFLPVMQKNLNADITGLILMYMLAFSVFLAGIYTDWRLSVVAIFLGVGVLAVAFVDQASALMVVLAAAVIGGAWLLHRLWSGTPR